ncbi:MerR family transcriptional regulator [Philodulcilactobacillus myokoensis]|uniref:MerR family transcriptional regulator n=1 Tax=Philodulcilactobacillus myokoensis TaxID=2929573 RepID=A0A9W6AY05_9LACO|nr:MerR family transcriptional regulator [Philodulcilactobacillus myokoensis]GLB46039.1 MerR family transcriptional regulator [Philodulcilactobacillus myokoensis]
MNIKEASHKIGVSSSTIRYYEKISLIPPILRNQIGIRDFDQHMIARIKFIKEMRAAGMSIKALQKYIHLFDKVNNSQNEQIELLKQQVEIMEEKRDDIQFAINHLNYKINHFYDHTLKTEQELKALEKKKH